ncbi:MAG: phospholipid-binding protein MlaC [Candidatus Binatia bacterium]
MKSQRSLEGAHLRVRAHAGSIAHRRAVVLLAILCGVMLGVVRAEVSRTAVVQQTVDAVVAVLADKSLTADQKRTKIQDIVYDHFDFKTLARLVLARNWKQLSSEQQKDFVEEFKKHLSMTYSKNVETYNNERAEVTGDRAEPGGDWTVKTKIVRPGGADILVDYRLRQEDGGWKAIDVIIEGVSLVANFRSQFQEIVSNQGPQKLIDLLREKNAKGEPLKS